MKMLDSLNTSFPMGVGTPRDEALICRRFPHATQREAMFTDPGAQTALDVIHRAIANEARIAYLTGAAPGIGWYHEPLTGPVGARVAMKQWYNGVDRRTAAYQLTPVVGKPLAVDLRLAGSWFPQETELGAPIRAEAQTAAWELLKRELKIWFGPEAIVFTTPAMTGRSLLEMTLPRALTLPPLDHSLREILYRYTHQGRIELFPARQAEIPAHFQLDARWAYASCCSHLPTGKPLYDHVDAYAPHVPGFYEVSAFVPRDWPHVGLLPFRESPDHTTVYPRDPGAVFDSFATGSEIELALREGWRVVIHSRLLWPETDKAPRLADEWMDKLRRMRRGYMSAASMATIWRGRPPHHWGMLADAVRHIHLDTVGSWASHDTERHALIPESRAAELPANALSIALEDGFISYAWREPMTPELSRWAHPELAGMVWGKWRRKLAEQALKLPFDDIVDMRTDGIGLARLPDVAAFGEPGDAPGTWRLKAYTLADAAMVWPASNDALLKIMGAASKWE
jgi:hypothetical protein